MEETSKDVYQTILQHLLRHGLTSSFSVMDSFEFCMLPLLLINIGTVRYHHQAARDALLEYSCETGGKEDLHTSLEDKRFWLRRITEDSEVSLDHLQKYIQNRKDDKWDKGLQFRKVKQDHDRAIADARRLEAELRDILQHVVGRLSIDESRKSLELSNIQIQESKQGINLSVTDR